MEWNGIESNRMESNGINLGNNFTIFFVYSHLRLTLTTAVVFFLIDLHNYAAMALMLLDE